MAGKHLYCRCIYEKNTLSFHLSDLLFSFKFFHPQNGEDFLSLVMFTGTIGTRIQCFRENYVVNLIIFPLKKFGFFSPFWKLLSSCFIFGILKFYEDKSR